MATCKPFKDIYAGGKELCENMWGGAFKYETNVSRGYTMWWYEDGNPNDEVTERLNLTNPTECGLRYFHKEAPGPEPDTFRECHPWQEKSCCAKETVETVETLKQGYGPEFHWDRCGPLSQACERFFVAEACFYECDPHAGVFAKYKRLVNGSAEWETWVGADSEEYNEWELHQMPIRADFCDAWWRACSNDNFCSDEDGNFFDCAQIYKDADAAGEGEKNGLSDGGIAGIVLAAVFLLCLIFVLLREKQGKPIFMKLEERDFANNTNEKKQSLTSAQGASAATSAEGAKIPTAELIHAPSGDNINAEA